MYDDIKIWKKIPGAIIGKGKYGMVILTNNEMKAKLREINFKIDMEK